MRALEAALSEIEQLPEDAELRLACAKMVADELLLGTLVKLQR